MLKIIRRVMSFADWQRTHPKDPPPGDMLDAQFDEIVDRVDHWDAKIRRAIGEDGKVAAGTVSLDALDSDFRAFLAQTLDNSVAKLRFELSEQAKAAIFAEKRAVEAESTAKVAAANAEIAKNALLEVEARLSTKTAGLEQRAGQLSTLLAANADLRTDWDDASQEAQAWTESSRLWAEHMPDTLPDNALKIMDITGDHWSSRWWANQAANAFGMLTSLYLGAHPLPPTTNNNGGPIQIGSIYYDTTTDQAYVWDGSQWQSFYGVQRAGMMTLWYSAAANQTTFPTTLADLHGNTFPIDATNPEGLDAHVNGVKLMPLAAGSAEGDWSLTGSTITFLRPLRAGDIVGIDVLMPVEQLGPGAVENWKLSPLTGQDGVKVTFSLTTADGAGPAVTIQKSEELIVSLDGVIQEPTAGYSAIGSNITFVGAPAADAKIFITWQRSQGGSSGGGGGEDEVTGGYITIGTTAPVGPAVNDIWVDTTPTVAGAAVVASYLGTAKTAAAGSPGTLSVSLDIGSAAATRQIIAVVSTLQPAPTGTGTFAGVTATRVVNIPTSAGGLATSILIAAVPSGSGSQTLTISVSDYGQAIVHYYSVTGASSTLLDVESDGVVSPLEVTIDGIDGGLLIAGLTAGSSTVYTLVGFDNQHSDSTAAFFGCTAGYDAVTSTGPRTQTQTSGESLAVISFAPLASVSEAILKTWNGIAWVYEGPVDWTDITGKPAFGTASLKNMHVGSTPPSSPAVNDVWIDTT